MQDGDDDSAVAILNTPAETDEKSLYESLAALTPDERKAGLQGRTLDADVSSLECPWISRRSYSSLLYSVAISRKSGANPTPLHRGNDTLTIEISQQYMLEKEENYGR